MLQLSDFDPADGRMREAIEAVGRRFGRTQFFDDVERGLRSGSMFLFRNDDGFVILRPFARDGKTTVRVVVAHSYRPVDAIETYGEAIAQLAQEIGAAELEFETCRAGFDRLAPAHGWRKRSTIWSRPLCESAPN